MLLLLLNMSATQLLCALLLPQPADVASTSPSLSSNSSHSTVMSLNNSTPTPLEWAFLIAGGLFWTVCYTTLILTTHRTRTTGMPYFALAFNLAWEALFAFVTPHPWPQRGIDLLWFTLDCVILLQTLSYFPYSASLHLSYTQFVLGTAATLATCFALVWAWTVQLMDEGAYSAFISNLVMSLAFVVMFLTRQPRGAGQSVIVAASKMAGTGCSSVAFYLLDSDNVLLIVCFVTVFVWDGVYLGMLVHHRLQQTELSEQEQSVASRLIRGETSRGMLVSHAMLTESIVPQPRGRAR